MNHLNILVINGSPKGENSITLQTVYYLQKFCIDMTFEVLHAGQRIRQYERDFSDAEEALKRADLILFAYPVYTFLVPAQLHRFIELIKENGMDLRGKYATQITTSKHFYDVTAHRFIQDQCDDLGMRYIRGLSADMEDLLQKKGQKEAREFFRYTVRCLEHGYHEPVLVRKSGTDRSAVIMTPQEERPKKQGKKAVIVTDLCNDDGRLAAMITRFRNAFAYESTVVDLNEFPFSGGCLGCFHCAADGTCIYKDGFDSFLREKINTGDAIIYAYTVKDHSMGSRFKMYDDRQFCNGHRTVTMGKPVGYLVCGDLSNEENLRTVMEARAQVGGNYLSGVVSDHDDPAQGISQLADVLQYCLENGYEQPKNFYGIGGHKIFRDLIWQMQGLMKEDHRFYKEHGFYDDFPQKKKGTIAGMYLVGAMMTNEKISKKIGGKMTEGMLMPYRKVLKEADRMTENSSE